MKMKIFNSGGLLVVVGLAVCSSLMLSIEKSSSASEAISWLEILRASVSGFIAMFGFFTPRKIETSEET